MVDRNLYYVLEEKNILKKFLLFRDMICITISPYCLDSTKINFNECIVLVKSY